MYAATKTDALIQSITALIMSRHRYHLTVLLDLYRLHNVFLLPIGISSKGS